jgi:hypothetical protein
MLFTGEYRPGGKLWSKRDWCVVPACQHDFGCCDGLIGGGPALKKGPTMQLR